MTQPHKVIDTLAVVDERAEEASVNIIRIWEEYVQGSMALYQNALHLTSDTGCAATLLSFIYPSK